LAEALDDFPVVVVTGARQTGKTTLLSCDPLFKGHDYVSLDDFAALEAARRNPEALLTSAGQLAIDEVQRCPELLPAIKRIVDRDRRPGQFVLTGSANLSLLHGVAESLAGRALYLTLHPLSRREVRGRTAVSPYLLQLLEKPVARARRKIEPLTDREVLEGGMPSVALQLVARRDRWFLGYEQTYLERDIRDLSQVADLVAFRNLLRLATLRTGQILNASEIARDARMNATTATRYLGLLEVSCVLWKLPPFLRNRSSRLIKSPKIFVSDSGLAAHLARVNAIDPTADEPLRGPLYETYVASNLAAILGAHRPGTEICFWNVQGRHEVDFVITSGRSTVAIEVKSATRFREEDFSGLRAFLSATPDATAGVLAYNGTDVVSVDERLHAVPLGLLLS
jgi:uncharacterized protein